jgi:hypothetical protein
VNQKKQKNFANLGRAGFGTPSLTKKCTPFFQNAAAFLCGETQQTAFKRFGLPNQCTNLHPRLADHNSNSELP